MPKILTDPKKIQELLTRGVEIIYPSAAALEKALLSGKRLRLYNGIDPTGKNLTLGHTVVLRKLEQFRALGHEVILLIGDFTGQIGDPSGKLAARKPLTHKQVLENAKKYQEQASKVLGIYDKKNPVRLRYNSEWWGKMSAKDLFELGFLVSKQRLEERDMFVERERRGEEVTYTELAYPLLQGYDSVILDVDLEVGGSDQTFNMLMGRRLMKRLKNKEKLVLATPLLVDVHGVKIGKTEGNMIALADPPGELYGKIMALGDDAIVPIAAFCTDMPAEQVAELDRAINQHHKNPRDLKALVARRVVEMCHSKQAAHDAEAAFNKLFRKHEAPAGMPEHKVKKLSLAIVDLLVESKLASSKSEARRLVAQGGVKVSGKVVNNAEAVVKIPKAGVVIQRGKRHFVRVKS